jgi:hypothetical protein
MIHIFHTGGFDAARVLPGAYPDGRDAVISGSIWEKHACSARSHGRSFRTSERSATFCFPDKSMLFTLAGSKTSHKARRECMDNFGPASIRREGRLLLAPP